MKKYFPQFILLIWLFTVVIATQVALYPNAIDLTGILRSPSFEYWLGQDDLGRSILHRLIAGAETSLIVSFSVTLFSAILGVSIGSIAAWFGGLTEHILVRVIDLFMAFPGILLAIALASILGPGINNLVIALSLVGWVGFARLTRAQVLSIKHRDHVMAAQAMGTTTIVIIIKHILPLIVAPLIIEATFSIASVIIAEAGLSFLGIGIQPPEASWGNMIRDGARYLLIAPHLVIAPGVALALVVLSINLLGDQLRDRLDKKQII